MDKTYLKTKITLTHTANMQTQTAQMKMKWILAYVQGY